MTEMTFPEAVEAALEKYDAAVRDIWYFPQWVQVLAAAARKWVWFGPC